MRNCEVLSGASTYFLNTFVYSILLHVYVHVIPFFFLYVY